MQVQTGHNAASPVLCWDANHRCTQEKWKWWLQERVTSPEPSAGEARGSKQMTQADTTFSSVQFLSGLLVGVTARGKFDTHREAYAFA